MKKNGAICLKSPNPNTRVGSWEGHYTYGSNKATNQLLETKLSGHTKINYTYDYHGNMKELPHLQWLEWNHQDELVRVKLDLSGNLVHYNYDGGGHRRCKTITKNGLKQKERLYLGLVERYQEYDNNGASAYRAAASGVDLSLKRYRFTGKERDEETGLDYFGVRYYASWLGRWTSGDPGGFVDGLNLYRYTRNNPVNGVDAEGYSTEPVELPEPLPYSNVNNSAITSTNSNDDCPWCVPIAIGFIVAAATPTESKTGNPTLDAIGDRKIQEAKNDQAVMMLSGVAVLSGGLVNATAAGTIASIESAAIHVATLPKVVVIANTGAFFYGMADQTGTDVPGSFADEAGRGTRALIENIIQKRPRIGQTPIKNFSWVSKSEFPQLYRGDTRNPNIIFEEGFKPKGGTEDLYDYVKNWTSSEFVSTSTNPNVGADFAQINGGGYLYILKNQGDGIDVNKTFKSANVKIPFPNEAEASVMRNIPSSEIKGAYKLDEAGERIKWIKNKNYKH